MSGIAIRIAVIEDCEKPGLRLYETACRALAMVRLPKLAKKSDTLPITRNCLSERQTKAMSC